MRPAGRGRPGDNSPRAATLRRSRPRTRVPRRSGDLEPELQDLLAKRRNFRPEQIHSLAHKGKPGKAECYSDNAATAAQTKHVQLNTLKAHGVVVNETGR